MNVDFCYQNCTVATNKSSGLLVKALEVVLKRRIGSGLLRVSSGGTD